MNRFAAIVVVLLGLSSVACAASDPAPAESSPQADVSVQGVTARRDQHELVIRNGTSERIYVATLEHRYFQTELALWCFGGRGCGTIVQPGATMRVEIATIPGVNDASSEVAVFWWYDRAVMGGQAGFDGVKQIVVGVR